MKLKELFERFGAGLPILISDYGIEVELTFLDEGTIHTQLVNYQDSVGEVRSANLFPDLDFTLVDWFDSAETLETCICFGPPARNCPSHGGAL